MTVVNNFTALLAINDDPNARWNQGTALATGAVVTYSFVQGRDLPGRNELHFGATGASALTSAQKASFRQAVDEYAKATGLIFVEVPSGRPAMIDVFKASGMGNVVGYANYPEASRHTTSSGDIAFGMSGTWAPGTWQYSAVLHELGHAVGLQHPHEGSRTLVAHRDSHAFTLQSYNFTTPYERDLGSLDLQALNFLYGAAGQSSGWTVSYNLSRGEVELHLDNRSNRIITSEDASFVAAFAGNDIVYGRGGNDRLLGQDGNDVLFGGGGFDRLWGQEGHDRLLGETGNDVLYGGGGNDILMGGSGNDWMSGGIGHDVLYGGDQNDHLIGWSGADLLLGGAGADVLHGHLGNDRLFGEAGGDRLRGYEGDDRLSGGEGRDLLIGEDGNDSLYGGTGTDFLLGGSGDDFLYGQDGSDFLDGGDGRDILYGDADNDLLRGGGGVDILLGGTGNDRLLGQDGDDRVWGGAGNDVLYGQAGRDLISGGSGDDFYVGGADRDAFIFTTGKDRIYDWEDGEKILISTAHAGGRSASTLVAEAQVTGGSTILQMDAQNWLVLVGLTDATLLLDDLIIG